MPSLGSNMFMFSLPCLVFGEFPKFKNVKHEVPTAHKLHDKEEVVLSLETRVERREERGFTLKGQDLPLVQSALHVVLLDYDVLLETLNSVRLSRTFVLGQKNLQTTTRTLKIL